MIPAIHDPGLLITRELRVDGVPFVARASHAMYCMSIFQGRYAPHSTVGPTEFDRRVRRVLDLGAGEGAFAVYAYRRWGAWVDAWEPDPAVRELLRRNAPPGCRVLDYDPGGWHWDDDNPYDVVRKALFGPDWPIAPLLIVDFQHSYPEIAQ